MVEWVKIVKQNACLIKMLHYRERNICQPKTLIPYKPTPKLSVLKFCNKKLLTYTRVDTVQLLLLLLM